MFPALRAPPSRRAARTLLAAAPLALAACSGPALSPFTVTVRDGATGQPLVAARVLAETPSRNHPFSIPTLLGQTGPLATDSLTDQRGLARLGCTHTRPVRLTILAPGYAVFTRLIDPPPGIATEFHSEHTAPSDPWLLVTVEPPAP